MSGSRSNPATTCGLLIARAAERTWMKGTDWGDRLVVVRADDLQAIHLLALEVEERSNAEELAVRRVGETLRREAEQRKV